MPLRSATRHRLRVLVPRSFRTQVALCFFGVAIAVSAVLSLTLGSMFSAKGQRDEELALRSVARHSAKALSDGLQSRADEIRAIANSPTLWAAGLSADRVTQTIARTQALTQYSAWIGVAEPGGLVRASTGNLLLGASVAQRPWFQQGKTGVHVGDVHDAKLLGSLLPKGSDGEPQRFVDFSAPVMQDGQLIGVLGMHGSWEWTRTVVEGFLPEDAGARHIQVFIIDRSGKLIYASGVGDSKLASAGIDPTSREFLAAPVKVPSASPATDLGWTVIAREPQAVVDAGLAAAHTRSLQLGLIAALVACLAGWLLAERLTRPLRQIAEAANSFVAGSTTIALPLRLGSSEVKRMSRALQAMTSRLLEANEQLELRVKERTAALEAANAELDRQARIDPLTGLLNRRGLADGYRQALASARRRATPLSVLTVDIDHFKTVNDTHGHDAGDTALQALSALLTRRLRGSDIVARMGGEEFVAILPDTSARSALVLATELVETVALEFIHPVGFLTISCGVAQVRLESDTAQSVLQRADEALYRAKREGRNHATFADTALELAPGI